MAVLTKQERTAKIKEHEAARWLNKKSMDDVDWLPADITLIEKVRERL